MVPTDLIETGVHNHILMRAEIATSFNLVGSLLCSSCGVCSKICPSDAILLVQDEEGYISPRLDNSRCIECGNCVKNCPILKISLKESVAPPGFAVKADDNLWLDSTSGGAFSLLAEKTLSEGGVVFGAVWKNDHSVSIEPVEELSQLNRLRHSKYVQSVSSDSYPLVKSYLDAGRKVLYSGLPCQVAGLNAYLGKECPNLTTIDVMCRGTPSIGVFKDYLHTLPNFENIKNVTFRKDKLNTRSIEIEYLDSSVEILSDSDSFVQALSVKRCLFGRYSCKYCVFAKFPRQGDITIGDFWGIKKFDANLPDPGTSLVLCNTGKGLSYFIDSSSKAEIVKPSEGYTSTPNRIVGEASYSVKKSKEFYDIYKKFGFDEACSHIVTGVADVGIVGAVSSNYGNHLTYYALFNFVRKMGKSAIMINPPTDSKIKQKYPLFLESPYCDYEIAKPFGSQRDMRVLNNKCKMFILGPDQWLRDILVKKFDYYQLMGWVNDTKYKCAYSASFGSDEFKGKLDFKSKTGFLLGRFNSISVREGSGSNIMHKEFGLNAKVVIDPVFLVDRSIYDNLIKDGRGRVPDSKYLCSYFIIDTKERESLFNGLNQTLNLCSLRVVSKNSAGILDSTPINSKFTIWDATVNEWLALINGSEYFITDSFHAVCFAIIFKKQFVVVYEDWQPSPDRITSLLEVLNLSERHVVDPSDLENISRILKKPIDYTHAYSLLEPLIADSSQYLESMIQTGTTATNPPGAYDYFMSTIAELNNRITELEKALDKKRA